MVMYLRYPIVDVIPTQLITTTTPTNAALINITIIITNSFGGRWIPTTTTEDGGNNIDLKIAPTFYKHRV